MRFAPTSFRPTFGRVLSIVTAVIAALGLGGFVVAGDWLSLLRYGWALLLLIALAFALFWFPRLDVAEHEVTVVNVFVTEHVPWPAIQGVDTKYALTLHLPGGRKVTAWASPAPNRYGAQVGASSETRLAARDGMTSVRPGDLPSTPSGAAALVIRSHWEQLRDDGLLELGVDASAIRRDIHWPTIIVLGALTLATIVGFAI
ncbi:PH domain-containing protein [Leifsonia sp. H3M29-4]|uniref:PH domain-containing protein n=1 Tax=Salinibacterium metalliresistens TaxID=3031321 RepID=UPI0023DC0316|nr:PH domain-containing protein [Salinibacterium metalliresistens]MDF1479506.1 PH domain-containing protein [Salinibacterium metalliresistens]